MGLLKFVRRRERIYSLLAGFIIVYVTWAFLTSQLTISSIPGEGILANVVPESHDGDPLVNGDVTLRKLQIKNVASQAKSSADQYGDEEDGDDTDTSQRREEVEDSISPAIKIFPFSKVSETNQNSHLEQRDPSALEKKRKNVDFTPQAGNVLPNYFIHADQLNKTRDAYGRSVVTYLHHNKAAGSSVKECLRKVSHLQRGRIGLLDSGGRLSIEGRLKDKSSTFRLFMGGYSFGICQQLSPHPCSYFTFVRDPYERVISSYSYCRRAGMDQLCLPGDPWKMNIKEWALFQGSFLFRQILFRPDFCLLPSPRGNLPKGPSTAKRRVPCWYREKVHLEVNLNQTSEDALIDYVTSNLERWFAVIGITDEYDASLAMLEEAYGIPFHARCSGKKINVSDYQNVRQAESSANETEHHAFVRRTKAELMSDEDVRRALHADIRLYERAKLIFEKQREKFKQIHGIPG